MNKGAGLTIGVIAVAVAAGGGSVSGSLRTGVTPLSFNLALYNRYGACVLLSFD